ncbi:MAG TPA: IucA/IucC family protein [Streptosporangiaceae bacterium]
MIGTHPAARAADAAVPVQDAARPAGDTALAARDAAIEAGLATAVIDTLLREDYAGLAGRVRATADGPVLDWPGGPVLPLRPDGFLADLAVAGPAPLTLGDVSSLLAAVAPAADADGVAAFGVECRQALATLRLRERHLREGTTGGEQPRDLAAESWLGAGGAVGYDALAAARPHPAYPTAACRLGFTREDSLRYAPEFRPEFELAWAAIPRAALVTSRPGRPDWWPEMTEVGLPAGLADSHELLPVHPLTARLGLAQALAEAGLAGGGLGGDALGGAVVAPGRWLAVRPTLSTRTVAVTADPGVQLKLPLPVSTLGRLNRRGLVPRTLSDGALIGRLLAGLAARDPALGGLLLADDGDFAHAGHPALGYLRRRLPDGLGACRVVSVAALLAPVPGTEGPMEAPGAAGRLVIDELAGLGWGGDPVAFFRAYLDLLFGVQVRLFTRYGIALESHQQNAAVVAGAGALRLLVKDFDGALIGHARLADALGGAGPEPGAFGDQRLLAGSDDELADVFITITVHLCAGALAFGLARRGYAPLGELLAAVRAALAGALDREDDTPAARRLRARVLEADRLTGKAMVTAGTLTEKSRSGARDINKFYGPGGPNYLKAAR